MVQGREEDGRSMPVSLVFAVANVDTERLIAYADGHHDELEAIYRKAHEAGFAVAAWYAYDRTTLPGVVNINNGGWRGAENIDGTRSADLTIAERTGMQVAMDFVRLARLYRIPGLEQCYLARAGAAVGVRDTRRIVGEYVVTVEDARSGAEFPDVIARKYGAIDANQLYTARWNQALPTLPRPVAKAHRRVAGGGPLRLGDLSATRPERAWAT